MKLTRLVEEYGALTSTTKVIEETCTELNRLRNSHQDRARDLHGVLQEYTGKSLPLPRNVSSSEAYDRYYEKLSGLAAHVSTTDGNIEKGDRVEVVKILHKPGRRTSQYYFGTDKSDIWLQSEWKVLQKKRITTRYSQYMASANELGYILDTGRTIGRNVAFHRKEIQKILPVEDSDNIDEIIQSAVDQSSNGRLAILDVIRRQRDRISSAAGRKCIYTVAKALFPEYKTAIGRVAAEV